MVAFSYFAISTLSPWQLGKDHDIKERNERIEKAFKADPVPVSQIVRSDGSAAPESEWTRVTLTGHYSPDTEVLLRLRPVDGTPAFQSLTPFMLTDGDLAGTTVLINRGWVAADQGGTKVPEITPPPINTDGQPETITITGMVRMPEGASPNEPLTDQGYQMVASIDTVQIAELTGTELADPYVQLLSDQPGVLNAIPLPMLDRGNHFSYGLQWIAFGIMAPAGLAYFIYAELRERRRVRNEQREMEALAAQTTKGGAGSPPDEDTELKQDSTAKPAAPARARYGSSRRNPWAAKGSRLEERG